MLRFDKLDIWKEGIKITKPLLYIVNDLEDKHLNKFAEQLRLAAISITNNLAEGSASLLVKGFEQFLNISNLSIFEYFNILFIHNAVDIINTETLNVQTEEFDHLSRRITNFRRTLIENK